MKEFRIFTPEDFDEDKRPKLMLLVCDERSITCANIDRLREAINTSGLRVVLATPESQYQKGLRGWAKVQILASLISHQFEGVMPLDYETVKQESGRNWAAVRINGPVTWSKLETLNPQEIEPVDLKIVETNNPFDRVMIERAKEITRTSNCWQDPAGCVFVKDGNFLIESASTSFNQSHCREMPINFKELELNPGERMLFCDSLHAERVGVTQASKKGISLEKSTAYVTKFPCRSCMLSLISAGVRTIVFDQESYGFSEVEDLVVANNVVLKRIKD